MRIRPPTEKQLEMLRELATLKSIKQIAKDLGVSQVVALKRQNALSVKFRCLTQTRLEVVLSGLKLGYLELEDDVHVGFELEGESK